MAMEKAVANLLDKLNDGRGRFRKKPCLVLDGNFTINFPAFQLPVIGGDRTVFSCSAASIIAKVGRDRLMRRYAVVYPEYGFEKHKGYPTAAHLAAIKKYGVLSIHRRTFAPVKCLWDNLSKERTTHDDH